MGSMILGQMVLPTPWDTIEELQDGLLGSGWLLADLGYTLIELVCGFALAAAVGLTLGFIFGINSFLRQVLEPYILNIYAIPKVTLFPIFLIAFGLGMESKVAFSFFHGVFPIVIITTGPSRTLIWSTSKLGSPFVSIILWSIRRSFFLQFCHL